MAAVPACGAPRLQQSERQAPAPIERRAPPAVSQGTGTSAAGAQEQAKHRQFTGPHGEHLIDWMTQHSNLSLQQQQQALEQEPGFRDLPVETQQRYLNRLAQLGAMNPQRREQLLARNEVMGQLTPEQRAQVRGALGQLGALPQDQRRAVAETFRLLRDLSPDQRFAALNSGHGGPPLNPAQRSVLEDLLTVAPILPFPNRPSMAPRPSGPTPPRAAQPGGLPYGR